jgi:hypothetical protein
LVKEKEEKDKQDKDKAAQKAYRKWLRTHKKMKYVSQVKYYCLRGVVNLNMTFIIGAVIQVDGKVHVIPGHVSVKHPVTWRSAIDSASVTTTK